MVDRIFKSSLASNFILIEFDGCIESSMLACNMFISFSELFFNIGASNECQNEAKTQR